MARLRCWFTALVLVLPTLIAPLLAQQAPKPLRVAVYDVAPYGKVGADGTVSGLSVDLWRRVAERLERQFKLTPVSDMAILLAGVHDGRFDLAIGAITITPERETLVDFSYPTHRSGVAVAVRRRSGSLFALDAYFAALAELAPLVMLIFVLLAATGLAMWRIKRAQRGGHDSHVTTLRDGMYWAAVTMTTVGYGDKTPKSTLGRIVAIAWMFASLVLVSLLSASLVSKLTADRVEEADPALSLDIMRQSLAATVDSSGAEYLKSRGLSFTAASTLDEALRQLEEGRATAAVNSVGALTYSVAKSHSREIEVMRGLLAPAYLAFALPPGSRLRQPIDEALIKVTASPEWVSVEERFFGR